MAWRIGVDIGGTFTDVALVDDASGHDRRGQGADHARRPRRGVLSALDMAMTPLPVVRRRSRAAVARDDRRDQCHPRGNRRARGADHDARLPRRAGAAPLGARRSLRPVPGRAGDSDPAPPALRDHRAHRRRRRHRHAARRKRDRWIDRGAQGGAGRGHRGLAAVQLPQPGARAAARRAAARGAAGRAGLSVVGCVARDQGVRAHQHDRGLRLCRADPRLLSRSGWTRPRAAARCRRST